MGTRIPTEKFHELHESVNTYADIGDFLNSDPLATATDFEFTVYGKSADNDDDDSDVAGHELPDLDDEDELDDDFEHSQMVLENLDNEERKVLREALRKIYQRRAAKVRMKMMQMGIEITDNNN